MSLKTSFRSSNARKQFIHKMDQKWEQKYQRALHHIPADEGFKYFEYIEE